MEQNNNSIGFTSLLTLLFIGLKLTGFIEWSWWWVLSPVWGSLLLGLALYASVWLFLYIKYWVIRKIKGRRDK